MKSNLAAIKTRYTGKQIVATWEYGSEKAFLRVSRDFANNIEDDRAAAARALYRNYVPTGTHKLVSAYVCPDIHVHVLIP